MTDNRTIKLAIVGALASASAFIVDGPVTSANAANAVEEGSTTIPASSSTVSGAPNSKHPSKHPHARSIVAPLSPLTKSQVTPLAPHTKSQVTPLAPHTKSQVTPLAPHTTSQLTPVAPHSLSHATPLRDPDALPAGVADRVAAIQSRTLVSPGLEAFSDPRCGRSGREL